MDKNKLDSIVDQDRDRVAERSKGLAKMVKAYSYDGDGRVLLLEDVLLAAEKTMSTLERINAPDLTDDSRIVTIDDALFLIGKYVDLNQDSRRMKNAIQYVEDFKKVNEKCLEIEKEWQRSNEVAGWNHDEIKKVRKRLAYYSKCKEFAELFARFPKIIKKEAPIDKVGEAVDMTLPLLRDPDVEKSDIYTTFHNYRFYSSKKETLQGICEATCNTVSYARESGMSLKSVNARLVKIGKEYLPKTQILAGELYNKLAGR